MGQALRGFFFLGATVYYYSEEEQDKHSSQERLDWLVYKGPLDPAWAAFRAIDTFSMDPAPEPEKHGTLAERVEQANGCWQEEFDASAIFEHEVRSGEYWGYANAYVSVHISPSGDNEYTVWVARILGTRSPAGVLRRFKEHGARAAESAEQQAVAK